MQHPLNNVSSKTRFFIRTIKNTLQSDTSKAMHFMDRIFPMLLTEHILEFRSLSSFWTKTNVHVTDSRKDIRCDEIINFSDMLQNDMLVSYEYNGKR